jgi:hypothetical protein
LVATIKRRASLAMHNDRAPAAGQPTPVNSECRDEKRCRPLCFTSLDFNFGVINWVCGTGNLSFKFSLLSLGEAINMPYVSAS